MSDKTYVFTPDSNGGGSNNGMLGILTALLQKNGVDPNVLLAMRNGNNGFGGEGGWFIWVIFLFFLMGWGNNGFGWGNGNGGGLANQINNDYGRDLLMQAINGNRSALSELATNLNCSVGQIQSAINSLGTQIQGVSNQVGMSSQQIINAIQAGDCNIASKLASCCCEIKQAIGTINVGMERGFSSVAYETQRQTCELQNAIKESTAEIVAGQRAAEMREMQRDLAERDREIAKKDVIINNAQQTTIFGQMISQATAPILAAVGTLQADVNGIKCKMPETTTVPYSPVVGVPSCVAAQMGLYNGLGLTTSLNPGFWG
ncbi:MAG: hypothetical protein NC346_02460 [Prevotella sp.]|nr:hypothetical protein [Bacteroidales bacterium]MCM1068736.1 hypothetical protein [Prevotella sp.]